MARLLLIAAVLGCTLLGAPKKAPPGGRGESESVEVTATVYLDKGSITELVGSDLDGHYVVVQAQVRSRFGREIEVRRDNFVLRTDKDGERSTPFAASQVAGRGALVISEGRGGGGAVMGDSGGPVWGGLGGDRPRRMGRDSGGGIGNSAGSSEAKATIGDSAKDKTLPPLQKTLEAKILPEGKTEETLSGLLYFPFGKQKVKDLELTYTAADGKIALRFK
jgi:hypothetical protein